MARSRNLKPSIFKNEILGTADPLYTILFECLWCLADREGRLEDRPMRIKVEAFPYRDGINPDSMLNWLENNKFIKRFSHGDEKYIQIINFKKHQNPHIKEHASTIPAPGLNGAGTGDSGTSHADSLNPLTDSLNPILVDSIDIAFDKFWEAYPKRKGDNPKKPAKAIFFSNVKKGADPESIIRGAKQYAREAADIRDRSFVAQAKTWLYQERWKDSQESKPKNQFAGAI